MTNRGLQKSYENVITVADIRIQCLRYLGYVTWVGKVIIDKNLVGKIKYDIQ